MEKLEIDQWMWCLALGFGSLIWGQLISSIPNRWFKKMVRLIRKKRAEPVPVHDFEHEIDEDQDAIERSKNLWMRGAHRLSNQIKVVEVFQAKLNEVVSGSEMGSVLSLKERVKELSQSNVNIEN